MLSRYFADSTSIGNTPVGTNVTVLPGNGTTVIFSSVSVAGNTTVATAGSGPVPPTGFNLGTPATFYDFQTTAVYAGLITVCIAYDPAAYGPPATLRLFHDETRWVDITTSNDTTNFVICGKATGLSRFAIFSSKPSTLVRYLMTKIKSLHLRHGLTHSLREKLWDVLRAIDSKKGIDTKKACREMRAFTRELQAKTGRAITPTTATMLLAEANMIKVALGCR